MCLCVSTEKLSVKSAVLPNLSYMYKKTAIRNLRKDGGVTVTNYSIIFTKTCFDRLSPVGSTQARQLSKFPGSTRQVTVLKIYSSERPCLESYSVSSSCELLSHFI